MPGKDPKKSNDTDANELDDLFADDPDFAEVNALSSDPNAVKMALYKKNRDKTAAKLVETVYYTKSIFSKEFKNDWILPANGGSYTKTSTFSKPKAPGQWFKVDLGLFGYDKSVQGWKLHVGCHPLDMIAFFTTLAPMLNRHKIMHKFNSFATMYGHDVGHNVEYKQGEGKTCVIYPDDPKHLVQIVNLVEAEITRANAQYMIDTSGGTRPAFRPYPGGVPGDMAVGRTGFVAVRYGGIVGPLPDQSQLFNILERKPEPDPRGVLPYPKFITSVPFEIMQIKAR
ncbi:MAG: hypothetical protein AAFQ59_08485 [Pseudomonadota bacterium]